MISLMTAAALLGAQPTDCNNALTQADMNECAARAAHAADAELNRVYPLLLLQMQAEDKQAGTKTGEQRLKAAQRAWIAYRDAQCALAGYGAIGGSLESTLVAGCLAEMTDRRTAELRLMLTGGGR